MSKLTVAALALMLALVPELAAQQAPAAPGSIVGFSSIPWGSPETAVTGRYGQPVRVHPLGALRVLEYSDTVLGESVITWYYIAPDAGLVAGGYAAPYTYGNSCWTIYSKFKAAITERYSNIRPSVGEQNQARSLDMCSAIGINRASAGTTWEDRENGSRAYVEIKNNPDLVQTMYMSAEGIRQITNVQAGERQTRF
jgi:hypothetical protein